MQGEEEIGKDLGSTKLTKKLRGCRASPTAERGKGAGRERWPRLLQCGSAFLSSLSRGLNAKGVSVQARPVDPVPLLGAQKRNMATWCLGREEGET